MSNEVQSNGLKAFNNAIDAINGHLAKVILHYSPERHYSLNNEDLKLLFRTIDVVEGMVRTAVASESVEEAIYMQKMYARVASTRRALVLRGVTREQEWDFAEENASKEDIRRRLTAEATKQGYKNTQGSLSEETEYGDGRDSVPTTNFDTGGIEGGE